MTCPKCGNKNVKKIFISGKSFEEGKIVCCDKCKPEVKTEE
jgi:hypothetical protein